jgi:hypothetical protein
MPSCAPGGRSTIGHSCGQSSSCRPLTVVCVTCTSAFLSRVQRRWHRIAPCCAAATTGEAAAQNRSALRRSPTQTKRSLPPARARSWPCEWPSRARYSNAFATSRSSFASARDSGVKGLARKFTVLGPELIARISRQNPSGAIRSRRTHKTPILPLSLRRAPLAFAVLDPASLVSSSYLQEMMSPLELSEPRTGRSTAPGQHRMS